MNESNTLVTFFYSEEYMAPCINFLSLGGGGVEIMIE